MKLDYNEFERLFKIEAMHDDEQSESYVNTVTQNLVGGHLTKKFVRVSKNGMDYFLNQAKVDNNNFVTYVNDIAKDGLMLNKVSVLLKSNKFSNLIINECVGSKLLNYYGVPTVYNFKYKMDFGPDAVASVDFVSENETFHTLKEITSVNFANINNVDEVIKCVKSKYNPTEESLQTLKEDFIKTFLVRFALLGDCDFNYENAGVIYNSKSGTVKLVNYDLEYIIDDSDITFDQEKEAVINYCYRRYPRIYIDVCKKLNKLRMHHDKIAQNCSEEESGCFGSYLMCVLRFDDMCSKIERINEI